MGLGGLIVGFWLMACGVGFRLLDGVGMGIMVGFWILDFGFWILWLGSGYWIMVGLVWRG